MTGWWWLHRSHLRRVARQEQAIADEQYRMMQPHAELNAHALHELLSGEPGGYQRWQSRRACRTNRGRTEADTDSGVAPPGLRAAGANQLRSLLRR